MISNPFNSAKMGFRKQLIISLIVISSILMIGSNLVFSHVVNSGVKDYYADYAEQILTFYKSQVSSHPTNSDLKGLDKSVSELLLLPSIDAFYLYEGNVLLFSKGKTEKLAAQGSAFLSKSPAGISSINSLESSERIFFGKQLNDAESKDQTSSIYAVVGINKSLLTDMTFTPTQYLIGGGGLFIILMGLLVFWALNSIFHPLFQLSKAMEDSSSENNYSVVNIKGPKEIHQIADAFNYLMKVVNRQKEALINNEQQLSAQVDMKTRELSEARDNALTASRQKSVFLTNITHELRTPIQAIIGYVDLITEEMELNCDDEYLPDLAKIQNNSSRLLELINSILDLSKLEAGKMDLRPSTTNIFELVNDAIESVEPLALKNDNRLKIRVPEPLKTLHIDKEKLLQVIINLLSNACKFTKEGEIYISAEMQSHLLVIMVKDNGIGMHQHELKNIFEEFNQVDSTENREFEGTGLGLAISNQFIKLLNGQLLVESEYGKGSTFTVKIHLSS